MNAACVSLVLVIWLWLFPCAQATDYAETGHTADPGRIEVVADDDCSGPLFYNHDCTFENGYAWRYGAIEPPYYGAFGEAYMPWGAASGSGPRPQNIAPEDVECIVLWLTDIGGYAGHTCDLYVWAGGVTFPPADVLCMVAGVDPGPPALWPDVSEHRLYAGLYETSPEFTVGYWGCWPGQNNGWYVAADRNGYFTGYPWTCLAPGSGYGTGWTDPSLVWGTTVSLGIGFTRGPHVNVRSSTWGAIKSLF